MKFIYDEKTGEVRDFEGSLHSPRFIGKYVVKGGRCTCPEYFRAGGEGCRHHLGLGKLEEDAEWEQVEELDEEVQEGRYLVKDRDYRLIVVIVEDGRELIIKM